MRRALSCAAVALGLAWVAGARGIAVVPLFAAATALLSSAAAARILVSGARLDPPVMWLAGLVAWAAVRTLGRPVAESFWVAGAALVTLALALAFRSPRLRRVAPLVVVTVGSLTAIWLAGERLVRGARPGGPFDNPNLGATAALLGLALVPWLKVRRSARFALATVAVAGVVATGSRGAMLGAVALALAWGIAAAGRRLRVAAATVALLAAAGLGARLITDHDPLRWERVRIWRVAVETAIDAMPLGVGPGGFEDAALARNFPRDEEFARYHRIPSLAESDFLQLPATLGLPGLLLGAGLVVSLAGRISGPRAWGVAASLAVTSAVNTQLAMPVLAWSATLALAAVLPPARHRLPRFSPSLAAAAALLLAVPAGLALSWPSPGVGVSVEGELASVRASLVAGGELELERAQVRAEELTRRVPASSRAQSALGKVMLARGAARGEAALVMRAAEAFRRARSLNPNDPFAAFGEAQAWDALGEDARARRAVNAALAIEPNFVGAWVELATLTYRAGEIDAARAALAEAEAARRRADPGRFVTAYERALAAPDPHALARLQAALGPSS